MKSPTVPAFLVFFLIACALGAQQLEKASADKGWVARSNENTHILLALQAKFSPESAGQTGFEGVDEQIFDLKPQINERQRQANRGAAPQPRAQLKAEKDPLVRQDLEILIKAADHTVRGSLLNEK